MHESTPAGHDRGLSLVQHAHARRNNLGTPGRFAPVIDEFACLARFVVGWGF